MRAGTLREGIPTARRRGCWRSGRRARLGDTIRADRMSQTVGQVKPVAEVAKANQVVAINSRGDSLPVAAPCPAQTEGRLHSSET